MPRRSHKKIAIAMSSYRPLPSWIPWIGLLLAVVVFVWQASRFWFYTIDDAFISYRYALHWAQGHGPVYNLGERVEGYTNFLWVAILAGFIKLHADPVLASKIIGLLTGIGTIVFLFNLGQRIRPGSLFVALSPLLTALHWIFASLAFPGPFITKLIRTIYCAAALIISCCFLLPLPSRDSMPESK